MTSTTTRNAYGTWSPTQIAAALGTPEDDRMAAAERDRQAALDDLHRAVGDVGDAQGHWLMSDEAAAATAKFLFSSLSSALSRLDGAGRQVAALTALTAERARRRQAQQS